MSFRSVKELTQELAQLKAFETPKIKQEQYATPPHIAADWLWEMAMQGELAGKTLLDAGCGPGILGLGSLLLGAKQVYFIESDHEALQICQENYRKLQDRYEVGAAIFIHEHVELFDEVVDVVLQNPPFGTKDRHADKPFLETAFRVAPLVYSMHKTVTERFVAAVANDHQFTITERWKYELPLKAQFLHHQKPVKFIDVTVFRLAKQL